MTRIISVMLILIFLSTLLSSCSSFLPFTKENNSTDFQLAEVLFRVRLPEKMSEEFKMMLETVDDVTGVYFNAARYEMSRDDDKNFSVRIPLKIATELKYRYVRVTDAAEFEQDSSGQQVRFRIARIQGPQIIDDIVTAWPGDNIPIVGGSISGQVIDQETNAPIPNLLISVGGNQALTYSDGSFWIPELVPGVHNLVIYAMDGAYPTFQQGAMVASGADTPVLVYLKKRSTTNVRFEVILPGERPENLPLRFISNLVNLGNAYADLSSGSSGFPENYPVLTQISANRYSIDLDIPVGMHLRYKYSFGDGFWNAELDKSGGFIVHDIVVHKDLVIHDRVSSFTAPGFAPVKISVKVPDSTPAQEKVFVQLKPFDWTEPLPMLDRGAGIWEYNLYSPFQYTGTLDYRFCRNGQCDIAMGDTSGVTSIIPLSESQSLTHVILSWHGLTDISLDSSQYLSSESLQIRPDFITGVELDSTYYPGWQKSIAPGLDYIHKLGGDFVILTPTWSANQAAQLAIVPGNDLQWPDLMAMIQQVYSRDQRVILYPQISYTQGAFDFYASDEWSEVRLADWFANYKRFLFHNAELANIMGVDGLIVAEPSVPYLSFMQNSIDTQSVSRAFTSDQWSELISGIRERYSGQLIGVMVLASDNTYAPGWFNQVDLIYALVSSAIDSNTITVSDIRTRFDTLLDEQIEPLVNNLGKPVIIGISPPSSEAAFFGQTISNSYNVISPEEVIGRNVDLEFQAKIYSAAIQSCAAHNWVQGFISRGFFPYVELQDGSSSIYNKPAADMLWFWYHYLLNKTP